MRAKHWIRQDVIDIVETHIKDEDLQGEVFGQIMWRYPDGKFSYADLWGLISDTLTENIDLGVE